MTVVHDALTGLFSRHYLEATLPRELSRAERHGLTVGIAALKIDNFDYLSARFGREESDALLCELGYLLHIYLRAEDIACRTANHEFMLVLPGIPLKVLACRMARLRETLERHYVEKMIDPRDGLAIAYGIASFPEQGVAARGLMDAARHDLGLASTGACFGGPQPRHV